LAVASAPGKVILFGEHAVVYGYPAIAVPVAEVRAEARVETGAPKQGTVLIAEDLDRQIVVRDAPDDDPLARIVRLTLQTLHRDPDPDLTITVTSTIPIARGMGSGAAVSTAIVQAMCKHFGQWLASRSISDLVYQAEVLYHGTPSGIDNTVVAFEKPVYFVKDVGWEVFWVGAPFWLAIADTGIASPTKDVVQDVRGHYQANPERYEPLFRRVGQIAEAGRSAIEQGQIEVVGRLMDENQSLLQEMGVSSPELDRLVAAAREGGAAGAKLCGAGRGGNMISLITEEKRGRVDMMLRLAGAVNVIVTKVS
jgi:mevalonate kinase